MATAPTQEHADVSQVGTHAYPLMLSRVTEAAAIASARLVGHGEKNEADRLATEAMREELGRLPLSGTVVIGEGERDEAPMLYKGEELGAGGQEVDIAVDPLEGTNLCANGWPESITMMATAEKGGLFGAPDCYMDLIVAGKEAKGQVSLEQTTEENVKALAKAYNRNVTDLTISILDRDRSEQMIGEIRQAGARVKLITDGTLIQAIAAMIRGDGVHALMGTSAAPEGVIKAACAKCLGGHMEGRFRGYSEQTQKMVEEAGLDDTRIYSAEELAPGEDIHFAATGVTDGTVLKGVRAFGGGMRTHTIILSTHVQGMRFLDTTHVTNKDEVTFQL